MKMNVRDDKNNFFISMQKFYSFQNLMYFLIMNFSWMIKNNSHVHWFTMTWRYTIKKNRLKLNIFENFTTMLNDNIISMYALICIIRKIDEISIEISNELQIFENVFFFSNWRSRFFRTTNTIMSLIWCRTNFHFSNFCTTCFKKN